MQHFLRALAIAGLIFVAFVVGSATSLLMVVTAEKAFASVPIQNNFWERYTRLPVLDVGLESAVTTSSAPVLNDTDTYVNETDDLYLEWGTAVSIECVLRSCFCLTMDDDVTIGSGATCGAVQDPNATVPDSTGGNACVTIPAGGRVEFIVDRKHWAGQGPLSSTSKSGYRTGFCASTDLTPFYPCDAANDCVAAGPVDGTCTTPAAGAGFDSITGIFLVGETASNTTCSIRKDL